MQKNQDELNIEGTITPWRSDERQFFTLKDQPSIQHDILQKNLKYSIWMNQKKQKNFPKKLALTNESAIFKHPLAGKIKGLEVSLKKTIIPISNNMIILKQLKGETERNLSFSKQKTLPPIFSNTFYLDKLKIKGQQFSPFKKDRKKFGKTHGIIKYNLFRSKNLQKGASV